MHSNALWLCNETKHCTERTPCAPGGQGAKTIHLCSLILWKNKVNLKAVDLFYRAKHVEVSKHINFICMVKSLEVAMMLALLLFQNKHWQRGEKETQR